MRKHMASYQNVGAVIGTAISATVLFIIGSVNMYVAIGLLKKWRAGAARGAVVRSRHDPTDGHIHEDGTIHDDGTPSHSHIVSVNEEGKLDESEDGPGFLTKCCPGLFQAVDAEWKMFPIGFLFGLGFDTASEVAVLALAALTPQDGMPGYLVLLLPLMFGSGMALVDTLDGMLMAYSYEWALNQPRHKLFYNLFLTMVTGLIALLVGLIESLGCIEAEMNLSGPFWNVIGSINDHFEYVGYSIIVFFVLSLAIALITLKYCINNDSDTEGAQGFSPTPSDPQEQDDPAAKVENAAIKELWRKSPWLNKPRDDITLGAIQPGPVSFSKVDGVSSSTLLLPKENGGDLEQANDDDNREREEIPEEGTKTALPWYLKLGSQPIRHSNYSQEPDEGAADPSEFR